MQHWSWLQAPVAMPCYSIGFHMGIFRSDIWDTSMLDTDTGYRYALILREAMNYGIEQAGRIATGLRWMCLAEDRARCLITEINGIHQV
jgi:hypothetical protein